MRLKRPTRCDNCNSWKIGLVSNHLQYGKVVGDWPIIYYCFQCKASVNCHHGTNAPLGTMADRETRRERRRTHKYFDKLWQDGIFDSRVTAYRWLSQEFGINQELCHIGLFDYNTCRDVTKKAKAYYKWRKMKRRDKSIYRRGKRVGR